jgi:hypothetical protein
MMAVLIAALLTCLLSFIIKYESEPVTLLLAQFSPELGRYYPLMLYSVWVFVPVFYGISCVVVTTCVGLRKALSHISQSIRRVAHGAGMPPA